MRILRHNSCCTFDPRSTVDVKPYRGNDFYAKKIGRKYDDDDDDNADNETNYYENRDVFCQLMHFHF